MNLHALAFSLAGLLVWFSQTAIAQHETTDETSDEMFTETSRILTLDLNNIDRYQYVILVDGAPTTRVDGYSVNGSRSWSRSPLNETRTVILDNLLPGVHTVTVEAKQDPNRPRAQGREEFLFEYEPLSFDVTVDPLYITRHALNVNESMNPSLIAHQTTQYTSKKWKTYTELLDEGKVEVRIRQYRKNASIKSAIGRLNMRASWALAAKHIYYTDVEVKLDGRMLLSEHKIPCSSRVTYQYYEPRKNQWLEDTFLDNVIDGRTRIVPYVRTVSLTPKYEMRIAGYDQTVMYTIVKKENPAYSNAGKAVAQQ